MSIPAGVILARLEHELEAARLMLPDGGYPATSAAIERAQQLAEQLREAL